MVQRAKYYSFFEFVFCNFIDRIEPELIWILLIRYELTYLENIRNVHKEGSRFWVLCLKKA